MNLKNVQKRVLIVQLLLLMAKQIVINNQKGLRVVRIMLQLKKKITLIMKVLKQNYLHMCNVMIFHKNQLIITIIIRTKMFLVVAMKHVLRTLNSGIIRTQNAHNAIQVETLLITKLKIQATITCFIVVLREIILRTHFSIMVFLNCAIKVV